MIQKRSALKQLTAYCFSSICSLDKNVTNSLFNMLFNNMLYYYYKFKKIEKINLMSHKEVV